MSSLNATNQIEMYFKLSTFQLEFSEFDATFTISHYTFINFLILLTP